MNSLEYVNETYKPYKITKCGKCTIINSTSGDFIIKEATNKDVKKLQEYLISRGFNGFAKICDNTNDKQNIYEYIKSFEYDKNQKAIDMIKLVANLHHKTAYEKEVSEDKYKEVYTDFKNNIEFYKNKYNSYIRDIENEQYMSPSHYLFIRNSSKLLNQISFCETKLDEWYDKVKTKRTIRVSTIHNNLKLDHYIKAGNDYLVSWDDYITDSPILDIYKFYNNEVFNIEFSSVLKTYLKIFPLYDEELDLLLLMLCLPKDINFEKNEKNSTLNVERNLNYVFKTENLVWPYYSKNQEK